MISYIHAHYMEKITLEQISAAGNVGKTTCTSIFKNHTNSTPVTFLIEYRLQKSLELLQNTDLSITEICYETGFSNASYLQKPSGHFMGKHQISFVKSIFRYLTADAFQFSMISNPYDIIDTCFFNRDIFNGQFCG